MDSQKQALPYPDAPLPPLVNRQNPEFLASNVLADIDRAMQDISRSIPMIDEEVLYKYECESQSRIYLFFTIIGVLMILLVILL